MEEEMTESHGYPKVARFYRRLPMSLASAETPGWRIELLGLGPGIEPLGLDILGDAVIGRGQTGSQPVDLDLDPFGALEQGVSRRHALLRPTADQLCLVDLGSTNGTLYNGESIRPGIACALKQNDLIVLGQLSFRLRIIGTLGIESYDSAQAATPEGLRGGRPDSGLRGTVPLTDPYRSRGGGPSAQTPEEPTHLDVPDKPLPQADEE
jgi:hypothetical protein